MNTLKRYVFLFILGNLLAGCATRPLNAPCDSNAHFCGAKTPINHWEQ